MLGVKPKELDEVAAEAGAAPAVLSMLGGTPLEQGRRGLPGLRRVAGDAQPRRPAPPWRHVLLGAPRALGANRASRVVDLLARLGEVVEMDESLIDAATAVMGCTPAYLALVAEAAGRSGRQARA